MISWNELEYIFDENLTQKSKTKTEISQGCYYGVADRKENGVCWSLWAVITSSA